jgi:hypothetical protein
MIDDGGSALASYSPSFVNEASSFTLDGLALAACFLGGAFAFAGVRAACLLKLAAVRAVLSFGG